MAVTGLIFAVETKLNLFWNPYMTENQPHNITVAKKIIVFPQKQGQPDFDLRDGGTPIRKIVKNLCLYNI